MHGSGRGELERGLLWSGTGMASWLDRESTDLERVILKSWKREMVN